MTKTRARTKIHHRDDDDDDDDRNFELNSVYRNNAILTRFALHPTSIEYDEMMLIVTFGRVLLIILLSIPPPILTNHHHPVLQIQNV